MVRMLSWGRDRLQGAWSASSGDCLVTGFPSAASAAVRTMVTVVGMSFGLFLTVRGMLLRQGLSFRSGDFYLPVRLLRREQRVHGSRVGGFVGWVVVVIVGDRSAGGLRRNGTGKVWLTTTIPTNL